MEEAASVVIGALACSIRGWWKFDVRERLTLIETLVYEYFPNNEAMISWLADHENWDEAEEDGRHMRDLWPGSYQERCLLSQLELVGIGKKNLGAFWKSHVEE